MIGGAEINNQVDPVPCLVINIGNRFQEFCFDEAVIFAAYGACPVSLLVKVNFHVYSSQLYKFNYHSPKYFLFAFKCSLNVFEK